ncbi:hypothetical protein [Parvibaculum sp.]
MNARIWIAATFAMIVVAVGVGYFLLAPDWALLKHSPSWRHTYSQCLKQDWGIYSLTQDLTKICGSIATSSVGRDPSVFAEVDDHTPLPKGQEPAGPQTGDPMKRFQVNRSRDQRINTSTSAPVIAEDVIQRIAVGKEKLQVVAGCRNWQSSDHCQSLVWQGKELLSDKYITLISGYPASGVPVLVNASSDGGGNCCAPTANIIDLTTSSPTVIKIVDLGEDLRFSQISPTIVLVSGHNLVETDRNGDPLTSNYLYYRDRKLLIAAPFDGKTDYSEMAKAYPFQLLADPVARKPLADILGQRLKEFREHIEVSSPGELLLNRYLIGAGCKAHSCNDTGGFYVVDIATGAATAVWFDKEQGLQSAGPEPTDYIVKQALNGWLQGSGFKSIQ